MTEPRIDRYLNLGPKRTPKRKRRKGPPRRGRVIDLEFMKWAAENNPCAVEGKRIESPCFDRLTFHHLREYGSPKSDRRGLVLCVGHHLHEGGLQSIEQIGKVKFEHFFGISLNAESDALRERYERSTHS